jgi:hypothetical protein
LEKLEGRDHWEDLDTGGKIILDWILEKSVERFGLDASGTG